MAAAEDMLNERHNPLPLQEGSDNQNIYTFDRVGPHNVILACLPAGVTGTISAVKVADQILLSFKGMRFGLIIEIGGGVPSEENDIRFKNVILSKLIATFGGIIQYDFKKTVQDGRFKRIDSLNRLSDVFLGAVSNLQ